ncbi:MAG: hypothetical protein ACWA6U_18450, partial [Breznakibacter sp.]
NLMDYANGTELWKYQWDLIHNPETILLGFMQDESEGAKEATPLLNVAWTKASVPDGLFLSPGGMPICLTGLTELALLKSAESGIDSRTVLKSVLYGFVKGEQRYFANFNGGRFTGYFQEGTTSENDVYTDTEGVTKKLVQSGRYDIILLGIDGEAPSIRQVDNNLWYDQPDWRNYTAQGSQLAIIDDYTFMPCGNLLRQYKDSPLMESHVLKTAILNNPCVLEGPMLHFADYQIESQWMKEFNQVFGLAANVAFFPAAVDVLFPIIVEKMGEEAGRRFLTGALIDLSANLIANQILGLENIGGEIIPDLVVAGLRDVFVNKSQVGQFILNCGIGINLETIGKIRNSKSGEEQFRLYRDLGIECLIPAVMGVVANKLAAKIANNPRTMSKSFQYLVDKAKLDETYIGTVLYDCLKLDVVLSSRNLVTKNLYKSILSTEFGAKAMDLLIEAQIDIATISGKNFQRLSNILAKFGTGQDDALLKILKETRDFNRMFTYLDNIVKDADDYVSDLAKIQANEMFKKSVTINGKVTTFADFFENTGGVYKYYCKIEGNLKYFVKMEKGTDGMVIIKEVGENAVNLSFTTFANWFKEKGKLWIDSMLDSDIKDANSDE